MKISCRIRRDNPNDPSIGIASPREAGGIVWLPRSRIEIVEHDTITGKAIVDLPRWLAIDRGIENMIEDD